MKNVCRDSLNGVWKTSTSKITTEIGQYTVHVIENFPNSNKSRTRLKKKKKKNFPEIAYNV